MLNLAKIQILAQEYTPQELFAALVWQRRFNEFNGENARTSGKITVIRPHQVLNLLLSTPDEEQPR
jgi:hypothetical protein